MDNFAASIAGTAPRENVAPAAAERAAFNRLFAAEIERAARYGRHCSLALLDIHHLRRANDARGRDLGDSLIAQIHDLIRQQLRQSDQVFRYGGDEFVLILPETDFAGAATVARRICEQADELCRKLSLPTDVRLRAGVSSFPQDAEEPKQLFLIADSRLRESKRAGQ